MNSERDNSPGSESQSRTSSSFGHLLAVWILVGWSLWSLGSTFVDALPPVVPLSQMGAGMLFGTVVVTSFWILGFRPSLLRSAGYFLVESVTRLFVLFTAVFLGMDLSPWSLVGLQGISIGFGAALAFTSAGGRGLTWTQRRLTALLKLPPSENRPDGQ